MDNKKIEAIGIEKVKNWLMDKLGQEITQSLDFRPNKGNSRKLDEFFGTDLRFKYNGEDWYVDIKASRKNFDGNIRLTYQTVNKLRKGNKLNRFLIAIVDNAAGKKNFRIRLLRFSDIPSIDVEPHFIFQQKTVDKVYLKGQEEPEKVKIWFKNNNNSDKNLENLANVLNKTVLDIIESK